MEILECQQLSDEWIKARLGSIGGSSISAVCAKGKGKTRETLLYRLAGEILSGEKYEGYQNQHMERGIELESKARELYEFSHDCEVYQVGLIRLSPHKHCSPDGLVESDGIIEIKCPIPSVHICTIDKDKIPPEYVKQIQWNLHISEREYCDFISYCPIIKARPEWVKRMERDEALIEEMDKEADQFIEHLNKIVEMIRG